MSKQEEKNQAVEEKKEEDKKADNDEKAEQRDSDKNKSGSKGDEESQDGRNKQKEFFKEELYRLEKSLQRESTKIKKPPPKEHMPFVWTSLEPYYNTYTARYLIELPEEMPHGYNTRKTAIGLCDPWTDLRMDRDVLPPIQAKPTNTNTNTNTNSNASPYASTEPKKKQRKQKGKDDKSDKSGQKERPPKEGSTRLPKYPVVNLETKDLATRKLYYSDVPTLRQELEDKYSSNSQQKIDEDYNRTKQDFYRMELDRLDQVHEVSRPHMRRTYFAYLQNTPGSRRALYDCMKTVEKAQ